MRYRIGRLGLRAGSCAARLRRIGTMAPTIRVACIGEQRRPLAVFSSAMRCAPTPETLERLAGLGLDAGIASGDRAGRGRGGGRGARERSRRSADLDAAEGKLALVRALQGPGSPGA